MTYQIRLAEGGGHMEYECADFAKDVAELSGRLKSIDAAGQRHGIKRLLITFTGTPVDGDTAIFDLYVQLNHDIRKMAGWRFAWLPSNAMPNHAIEAVRSYADLFRLLGIESECFSDRGKAVAWCERA